jgi:pimeloyl-ACP methyl ester carboxylesterase
MTWHVLERDDAKLSGFDGGEGLPVIFQHGLGGDETQVSEIFPDDGHRRLTLECRGHGKSEPGDPKSFSIATFADDVLAFADERKIDRFAIGGISMGAAIALRIAVKKPERISALILARPAWMWGPAPDNMQVVAEAAKFIRNGQCDDFAKSKSAQMLKVHGPDNLASLLRFFDRPNPSLVAELISAIAADGPGISEQDIRSIRVPTLVIATVLDWVHPLSLATALARLIPHSALVEITPKAIDKIRHTEEFRITLQNFLDQKGILN